MNGPYLYKNQLSYEADTVEIFGGIVIGAAGAVTSFQGGGVESVVKETAAGQYTIKLKHNMNRFLFLETLVVGAAISTAAQVQLLETPATLQADFKGSRELTIQIVNEALAAVNLASGNELKFKITARRTEVGPYDA
jgi:hypothetical protein